MSRKVTVKFNYSRNWCGKLPDGSDGGFKAELDKEYAVTLETICDIYVNLTMLDGLTIQFYHPGHSTSYHVVREGWTIDPMPTAMPTSKPILESTIIMTIEPSQHNSYATNTEYLIYKLPRTLNGLIVDRGCCDQETVCDRANSECIGELHGVASFMLVSRSETLRYRCVSFRIDNKTKKKNLISQYGRANVCAV